MLPGSVTVAVPVAARTESRAERHFRLTSSEIRTVGFRRTRMIALRGLVPSSPMFESTLEPRLPRSVARSARPDLPTAFIAFVLLCYPFGRFVSGLRLGDVIYFDWSRLAVLTGAYILTLGWLLGPKTRRPSADKTSRLLSLLVLSLIASLAWSVDRTSTLRFLLSLIYAYLFYLICLFLLTPEYRWYRMKSWLILLPFFYFVGTYLFYLHYGTLRPSAAVLGNNVEVISPFTNWVASAAETSVPFLLAAMIGKESRNQFLLAFLALLAVTGTVMLSESRGSLFTTIFMTCLFLFFVMRRRGRFRSRVAVVVFSLGMVAVTFAFSPVMQGTRADIYTRLQEARTPTENVRFALYAADADMIRRRPLLGYGYGTHSAVAAGYGLFVHGDALGSHDVIVDLWQGAGIISVLIFAYLIFVTFRRLRQTITAFRDPREWLFGLAVMVSLAGVLVHALFRPVLDNPNLYLLLAMSASLIRRHTPIRSS